MEDQYIDAPLLHALAATSSGNAAAWHMPGHLSGRGFSEYFRQLAWRFDTTELPSTDDINQPSGPALIAMQKAAKAFMAGMTRFITCGSTGAIHILLAATAGRKGSLLIPRSSHQSVLYAASLLDLEVLFLDANSEKQTEARVPAGVDPLLTFHANNPFLFQPVSAASVEQALKDHPQCKTVLITSPDYYGQCCDIRRIARICHQQGACLLVDEAHGAHLPFSEKTRHYCAMASGADACVQSGHKTLPVLTQGAYLHVSRQAIETSRISEHRIASLIPVYQTSSPSFLIAASLDYARAIMEQQGEALMTRQISLLSSFISKMTPRFSFPLSPASDHQQPVSGRLLIKDPIRVVMAAGCPSKAMPAGILKERLAAAGTQIEFADLIRLVLIPSLFHESAEWDQLTAVFYSLYDNGYADIGLDRQIELLEVQRNWQLCLRTLPESVMKPGDVLFGTHPSEKIYLRQAEGSISAQALIPYPPGIPLIWPGERIEKRHLRKSNFGLCISL